MKKYDRYLTRGYLVGACLRALEDKTLRPRLLTWIANNEEELAALDGRVPLYAVARTGTRRNR